MPNEIAASSDEDNSDEYRYSVIDFRQRDGHDNTRLLMFAGRADRMNLWCHYCGSVLGKCDGTVNFRQLRSPGDLDIQIDRQWPAFLGGSGSVGNCVIACRWCNRAKAEMSHWSEVVTAGLGHIGLDDDAGKMALRRIVVGLMISQNCSRCRRGKEWGPMSIDPERNLPDSVSM